MTKNKQEAFWMVWNPSGRPPSYKHRTLYAAREEAQRLARTNPGEEFIVLGAVAGYKLPSPDLDEIEYDEIPF